jgi:hypothetical protein
VSKVRGLAVAGTFAIERWQELEGPPNRRGEVPTRVFHLCGDLPIPFTRTDKHAGVAHIALTSMHTAGCADIDPCTPCICKRSSTPFDEGCAHIMLRGSTTLKTAVGAEPRAPQSVLPGAPCRMLDVDFREFTFHALGCIMDQGVWEIGIEREQSRGSRPSSGVCGWRCGGLRWCIRCV